LPAVLRADLDYTRGAPASKDSSYMTELAAPRSSLAEMLDPASRTAVRPVPPGVVVYGAGQFGRAMAGLLERAGSSVHAFIDQSPRSDLPWPVIPLSEAGSLDRNLTAVVGIFNPMVDIAPIAKGLRLAGFQEVLTPVQAFHRLAPLHPEARYWLTTLPEYISRRDSILEATGLFADDKSRSVYGDLWRYRLGGDVAFARPAEHNTLEDQYFPSDLPPWGDPLRLVDAGAYTGDTLLAAQRRGLRIEAVAAFEPDPANFARLGDTLAGLPDTAAFAVPCGVLGSTGQVRFTAGAGAGSAISADGSVTIQCVSLDESLHGFRPNLIKMDIEGAEPDALLGARRIIASSRPGLAVCVYHAPDHLWSIPLLLREWDLGYRFYLRSHAFQGFDTVLYAVPD
jgi:FkbM family methyltransferase